MKFVPSMSREEFERKYPNCSYDGFVAGELACFEFYSQPAAALNRCLVAQADENRARGYSND